MLLMAAFAVSTASAYEGTPEQLSSDPAVRKGKLANGMTYYIRHNEKPKGQADFYIWHDVGAIQELDNQQGLAHFLEHMAFNGTKNLPGKMLTQYLETIGVKFGADLNAYTTWDRTVYNINNVPTKRQGIIDTALLILHDWSHFIALEPEEIDSERGVIMEELRTRDNAQWRSTFKMLQTVAKNTMYEKRNLIGYLDDLKTFEHSALETFYQKWYRPEYQALVIVGDIDVDAVEKQLTELMKDIPASPKNAAQKKVIYVPENKEPIVSIYTDREMQSTSAKLIIKRTARPEIWNNTIQGLTEDAYDTIISIMTNARLGEIAMQENAPFMSAGMSIGGVGINPTLTGTMFVVQTQDGMLQKGFETLYTEMERVRRFGFTEGELQRTKKSLYSWMEMQHANSKNRSNAALVQECLNNYDNNAPMMDPDIDNHISMEIISKITIDDLNKRVADLISAQNQVIIVDAPEKEGLVAPSEEDMLKARAKAIMSDIAPYQDKAVGNTLIDPSIKLEGSPVQTTSQDQLLGTTEWTLKNGAKIIVKSTDFQADEMRMTAYTKGGGLALIPEEDYHLAMIMPSIAQMSGVANFSAMDLSKMLAGKSASASTYVDSYRCGMSASCAVKDMETMFQLMYLSYTQPRFGKTEYDMMMTRMRTQLANIKTDPNFLMSEARTAALYNNNPLRQDLTEETLNKFDFEKLPELYKTIFNGVNGWTFIFVGHIDLDALKPMVEKYIGSLPADNKKHTFVDDNVRITKGQVEKVFRTPMQQPKVSVFYNWSGKSNNTLKDDLTIEFLGEALNSRYLISIREEKGGTYGVGVGGRTEHDPEMIYRLMIMFDTNEEMADELMEIIVKELETIAKEGPVAEDLEKHRKFLLKQYENSLENNGAWMNYIMMKDVRNKNLVADYAETVRSITAEDVQNMAKRVLKDNNLVHVVMRPEVK